MAAGGGHKKTERASKGERVVKTDRASRSPDRASKADRSLSSSKPDRACRPERGNKTERAAGLLARLFPSGEGAAPGLRTNYLIIVAALSLLFILLCVLRVFPLLQSRARASKEEQQRIRMADKLDDYSEAPGDFLAAPGEDFQAAAGDFQAAADDFQAAAGDSRAAEKTFSDEGIHARSSLRGLVSSADILRNPSAFQELLEGKGGRWGGEGEGEEEGGGGEAGGFSGGSGSPRAQGREARLVDERLKALGTSSRESSEERSRESSQEGSEETSSKSGRSSGSRSGGGSSGSSSGISSGSSSGISSSSRSGGKPGAGGSGEIPVVQFLRAQTGCGPGRYAYETMRQARRVNSRVILIGPGKCKRVLERVGVEMEDYDDYMGVEEEFEKSVGEVVSYQVRWFILHEFMRRWGFKRIFYMDCDVLLFANVTQFVQTHLPKAELALAVRTPTIHVRAVSAHVSLWSQEALADFLTFFRLFFQHAVVGGTPGDRSLPAQRAYNDMVVLGWYAAPVCWTNGPRDNLPKDCLGPSMRSMSARIRGKFTPAFKAESLCAPRQCQKTTWSDAGWCAFDNNFSLTLNHTTFHYDPLKQMKTPTSMHYDHFTDWVGRPQDEPVQFLGVHFQGPRKATIMQPDPSRHWGSSPD
ncbi:hypothetical protein CLOM_g22289 [Closterium sp. NIES-68]|nr:hypothetical protein CLOM_g22289 [Closterium sp. NIES-68]GJP64437.1 hypothetical protein CLOP_g21429 [Closterium sp. NIES-67]GJP65201.1 hypothetical protein CLOP_g22107 [Closterium sp. NIES-67]